VTGGRDIFVSEEPVPFNAVETRSRKKKQDEADKKIDETTVPWQHNLVNTFTTWLTVHSI
jgi:hypothetical protein